MPDVDRAFRIFEGRPRGALSAADLVIGIARARLLLRRARLGGRVYAGGPMRVVCDGRVSVGHLVCFFGGMIASEIVCHPRAEISIGGGSELNYGVSIEAARRVSIGARCKIGSMVHITDVGRSGPVPVIIGDDVWIAHGALIEPGAAIGDGSVVSAGSVVTGPIPAGSLAIGNPARAVPLGTLGDAPNR